MVCIIVATHGDFSEGIIQSAQMILGQQEKLKAVTFKPGEGTNDLLTKFDVAIRELPEEEEILFLVDLFGGSPFNTASRLVAANEQMALLTGVNLPMLIEACLNSTAGLTELVERIENTGKEGIKHFELMEEEEEEEDLL